MASTKIKGITIEIDGDTTKLGKALESSEQSSKKLQSELKGVNTLLKMDPSNVELLTQKQKILTDAIASTSDKLDKLKQAQEQVQQQFDKGEITEEQFRDFQREIVATEQSLKKLEDQAKDFGNVMSQQLKSAGDDVKDFGGKIEDAGNKIKGLSTVSAAGFSAAVISAASLEDATAKYIATTGKAKNQTDQYQKVLQKIHDNNYGEDFGDIADKMRIVSNILGDLPDDELQSVVEKSYMLQDAYDMDFQENIRGVNSLMDQFGITSEQAYELINQGAQKGLNQNQDLTDQIAEYSTYYAKLGFTAEEFFNMMVAGAKDGAYQIDYLNDAMKEFGIRTKDNSKSTNEAYEKLGLDVESVNNEFAQGGETAKAAFKKVVKAIESVEDPVKRNEIGVALFGTKFEDLEDSAVMAMANAADEVNMLGDTVEKTGDTMYNTTAKNAEQAMKRLKTAFAGLGESALPIIEKVVTKLTGWIDKFNSLDEGTKKVILTVTGLVAALAPALIIGGKVISGVGTIIGVISKLTAALGLNAAATGKATTAQLANNAAVLANPYVLAAAAVAGLTAALVIWFNKSNEKTKQLEEEAKKVQEETKAVQDNAQAYKDATQARADSIEQGLQEMGHYENLYSELQGIVDQNGKVKEGYEARAKFIATTLSEALGFEISLVDGQIQGYEKLTETFDAVMEKKKAMLILEAQEDAYVEALKNRTSEMQAAYDAQKNMEETQLALLELSETAKEGLTIREANNYAKQRDALEEKYKSYQEQYNAHSETYEGYLTTIGMYEDNYEQVHNETYDNISANEDEYRTKQKTGQTQSIDDLKKNIADTEGQLNLLKEFKKKNNTDIYDEDIKSHEKQLNELKGSLNDQVRAANIGNSNITDEWLNGKANQLSAATGKKYEFKKAGDGTVQMYIDGVKAKTPVAEKDMEDFADDMVGEVNKKKTDAETSGKNLIEGVNSGVKNQKTQSSVFSSISTFASNAIAKLKSVFQTHSPSKVTTEIGGNLDEGVSVGVRKGEKSVLNDIGKFGKDVNNALKDELSDDVAINSKFNGTRNLMMNALTGANSVKSTTSTANDLQTLTHLLSKYMPEILANMNKDIIMDGRVVAKTIAPEINKELGIISSKEQRGY